MRNRNRLFLVSFICLFLSCPALAKVKGECGNCHTMHNSQQGSVFEVRSDAAFGLDDVSGFAVDNLLINNCIGCHSSTGAETIVGLGASDIPIVYNLVEPTKPLAGGNFYWVEEKGDNFGHNVRTVDADLFRAPGTTTSCGAGSGGGGGLTGGCHASLASIAFGALAEPVVGNGCVGCHDPAHHADDETRLLAGGFKYVDETGGGYRFINKAGTKFVNNGGHTVPAMVGIEAPDWEQNPSASSHNEYQDSAFASTGHGMSDFCTGCHDGYHSLLDAGNSEGDLSSPWLRHPAGIVLPDTGEYAAYQTYNPQVPIARPTAGSLLAMAGPSAKVTPGTDKVMCLSCHRVHGSPYPDMLRWNYTDGMIAGTTSSYAGTGCFVCHSQKDGEL